MFSFLPVESLLVHLSLVMEDMVETSFTGMISTIWDFLFTNECSGPIPVVSLLTKGKRKWFG